MDWLLGRDKKKPDEPASGETSGEPGAPPAATPAADFSVGQAAAGTTADDEPVTRMKKGAYLALTVVVLVTGEDAPAHPFVPDAEQVVREMLASGHSTSHPDWQVTVAKVSETEMPGEWD
jgi:hypothetical protein